MSLDNRFSENDPAVLEAVEKQYLYGRTKEVLRNLEKDTLDIFEEVMRCHRLDRDYPNYIPTLELISVALASLRKRYFSESEMKMLEVFKRRIRSGIDKFLDIFDAHESEYGRAASSLATALHSLNPFLLNDRDFLTMKDGIATEVIGGVLNTMDNIDDITSYIGKKFKRKDKGTPRGKNM